MDLATAGSIRHGRSHIRTATDVCGFVRLTIWSARSRARKRRWPPSQPRSARCVFLFQAPDQTGNPYSMMPGKDKVQVLSGSVFPLLDHGSWLLRLHCCWSLQQPVQADWSERIGRFWRQSPANVEPPLQKTRRCCPLERSGRFFQQASIAAFPFVALLQACCKHSESFRNTLRRSFCFALTAWRCTDTDRPPYGTA